MVKALTPHANWPAGSFQLLSDTGTILTAEMSVDDRLAMADHPRQRNTQRHARAGHWPLAKNAKGAVREHLAHVTAAVLEGYYYKVDGHTRAALWAQGALEAPPRLHVTIYRVNSLEELNELYTTFDAQSAAETKYDKVYGAYRACGLQLRSKRLRNGFIVDALNIALRGAARPGQDKRKLPNEIDVYKAVAVLKEELTLLDSVDPQPDVFYSGVIAAALIGLSLYPEEISFFQKLAAREGNKQAGRMDPVEAILVHVDTLKQQHASWVNAHQEDLCARCLRALLAWRGGQHNKGQYWFKTKIRALDIDPLVQAMKAKKGIADDPLL